MKTPIYASVIVSTFVSVATIFAQPATVGGGGRYVEGELLVKFEDGPKGDAAARAKQLLKHDIKHDFDFAGWQCIRLRPGTAVKDALAEYEKAPSVLAVEPNYIATAIRTAQPNDPMFGQQWSLPIIRAAEAWGITTGSNVVVAVMDNGVNYTHEDLQPNMWRNAAEIPANGIDDDNNGYVDDIFGIDTADDFFGNDSDPRDQGGPGGYHGSSCAGIIGAAGNNGIGIAGINWSLRLMAIRTVNTNNFHSVADRMQALSYIVNMKARGENIRAINMSWGDGNFSQAMKDAHDAVGRAGIVQVCATDNRSVDMDVTPDFPGNYDSPAMIVVASSDQSDNFASFSAYGRTNVDIAAPGVSIPATGGPGAAIYNGFTGNSAAAPHVSGAVALLAAIRPAATAQDIKTALLESVDQSPSFTNKIVSHGRLNLAKAALHPLVAVDTPALVTRQPESQMVPVGGLATFSVGAWGTPPLQFHWRRQSEIIAVTTNGSITLSNVVFLDAGAYDVVITNAFGSSTSQVAVLNVVPLLITVQPRSQNIRPTSNLTVSVSVTSTVPVSYQWRFNGAEISDANSASLTLTNIQLSNDGGYSVVLANSFGSVTSQTALVRVLVNLALVQAPLSQSIVQGSDVTFSVAISGNPPPFGYIWRRGSTTVTNIAIDERMCFFTMRNIQSNTTGRIIITNAASTLQIGFTNTVLFDSDGDGLPDVWEVAYGLKTNDMTDAIGDLDDDGRNNLQEYVAGTDPTNSANALRIDSVIASESALLVGFMAASNRTYSVESHGLAAEGAWNRVADVVATISNGPVNIAHSIGPGTTNQQFYRLVTPRRP